MNRSEFVNPMKSFFWALILIGASCGTRSASAAEVVDVGANARAIYPQLAGYNSDYYYTTNPWESATRLRAATAARPGLLRYPGGTSSSYWDVYRSRIFRDVAAIDPANSNPAAWTQTRDTISWVHNAFFWTNVVPLSDWAKLEGALRANGDDAATIFVANMVTPGADYYDLKWQRPVNRTAGSPDWWTMMGERYGALKFMLGEAKNSGLPVRYVELGNEYYFGAGPSAAGKPAVVEPYVAGSYDADNNFAFRETGAFPDKVGKDDALYLYGVAANDWAGKIKRDFPDAKVCAVGAFVGQAGETGRTARWNAEALEALDANKVDAISLHFYGGPQRGSLTEDEAKLGQALQSWQEFWRAGVARSQLPALDWWITEFNIDDEFGDGDKLPASKGTWGNGLGNLYCLNYWLAHEPHVQVALMHELARVIEGDGPAIKANGRAWGLWSSAATGKTRVRALNLTGVPNLQGADTAIKGVIGWQFDTPDAPDSARIALVNFTATAQAINGLDRVLGDGTHRYVQAASALGETTDPGEQRGEFTNNLSLPPFSVTVIER